MAYPPPVTRAERKILELIARGHPHRPMTVRTRRGGTFVTNAMEWAEVRTAAGLSEDDFGNGIAHLVAGGLIDGTEKPASLLGRLFGARDQHFFWATDAGCLFLNLADATLGPVVLLRDPEAATRIRDVIKAVIDNHRFPWISADRAPTDAEREMAIASSSALAATRDVEIDRRSLSKNPQEEAVKEILRGLGMSEVAARDIPGLTSPSIPAPGEFCGESRVAGTRADVVARLPNGELMLVECKVSNSTVNSYKRIVHDTGGKAAHWYRALGQQAIIPCAALGGVFSRANIQHVQGTGVYFFWQHRLQDLADFVSAFSSPIKPARRR